MTHLIFFFFHGASAPAVVVADPDFAGATIHRAHLRHVASARTRESVRAQTRRANRDR